MWQEIGGHLFAAHIARDWQQPRPDWPSVNLIDNYVVQEQSIVGISFS
jgi:hypothetical protein